MVHYKVSQLCTVKDVHCQTRISLFLIRLSIIGRLVRDPYSGIGKKAVGMVLKKLQKSPKQSDLLDDLWFKLRKYGMLSESELRPGQRQVPSASRYHIIYKISKILLNLSLKF